MKKLITCFASLALCSTAAIAADLPMRQPIYGGLYAPVSNWSGCYIGAQVGYGRATTDLVSGHVDGGNAGGQLGCNIQTDSWVWGLEGDLLWSDIKDGNPATAELKADWLGSVRMRAGIASPTALLYATGGLGVGHAAITVLGNEFQNTHYGWVAGGGIEWFVSPGWTAKVEYLHYEFGKENYGAVPIDYNVDSVKVGFNYKFGN